MSYEMEKKEKTFEDIKKEIRSLLISSPVGLRLQDLLSDYRSMIGKHLPFKEFGYSSALEMVKHMPDVVFPVFRPGGAMFLEAVPDKNTMHIKKLVLQQKNRGRVTSIRRPRDEALCQPPPRPTVPALLRMKIKELLKSHPNGVDASVFGALFKKRFGSNLDFQKHGYSSLIRLLGDCSDIAEIITKERGGKRLSTVTLKKHLNKSSIIQNSGPTVAQIKTDCRPSLGDMDGTITQKRSLPPRITAGESTKTLPSRTEKKAVFSVMDLEPEDNDPPAKEEGETVILTQTGVSDQLKSEIKSLLERKKNGVWLARFPFEYKKQFSKELNMKAAGYLSLISLMGSLPDIVRIDRPVKNGDWLLHGISKVYKPGTEDPIPKDAVKYDGVIQKMPHPVQGQMEIFIVQIEDPGDFFFHWFKKREALDELMMKMSDFYKSVSSQNYILPDSHRKTGQVCAAVYDADNEWYRALICRVLSENEIEVIYADYGNKAIVNPIDLRLLRQEFIELPAMCIKGSLAKIRPLQSTWSSESATRFFELTKDKILLGKILEVKDSVVSLDVICTNYNNAVHVNDTLVVEKHAAYIHPPSLQHPVFDVNVPNIQRPPSLMYFQYPYYGAVPMATMPFPQPPLLMNASQHPSIASYQFTPMQQGPAILSTQQSMANTVSQRSVSLPTPTNAGRVEAENSQEFSYSESVESLINDINLELDDKSSVEGSSSDEEDFGDNHDRDDDDDGDESVEKSSNVKRILCEQYKLHIIKFDGVPYATRGEISALFWYKDILRQMLRQQNVTANSIVIPRESHSELFDELRREGVKDFIESEELKEYLTLYELESLPLILNTFKHRSKDLRKIIDEEIAIYKNSPEQYMEEESLSEIEEDIEEDSMALELELEEFRCSLQALQFRRKRLVNSMIINSKASSADKVNELKGVEKQIEKIRKKIQMKEGNVN